MTRWGGEHAVRQPPVFIFCGDCYPLIQRSSVLCLGGHAISPDPQSGFRMGHRPSDRAGFRRTSFNPTNNCDMGDNPKNYKEREAPVKEIRMSSLAYSHSASIFF